MVVVLVCLFHYAAFAALNAPVRVDDVDVHRSDDTSAFRLEVTLSHEGADDSDIWISFLEHHADAVNLADLVKTGRVHAQSDGVLITVIMDYPIPATVNGVWVSYKREMWLWSGLTTNVGFGEDDGSTLHSQVSAVCQPQCTTFVHQQTGINFKKCWNKTYGNAGEWYDRAKSCGFKTSSTPDDHCIGEMKSPGHVFEVVKEKKIKSGVYELTINDSNWNRACGKRWGVKALYYKDKKELEIPKGSRNRYKLSGFITKW